MVAAPPVPAPSLRARPESAARPGPLVSATVALLVAATAIPLGYVVWGAVSVGWTRAYELVVRPRVGELLVNTVALVAVTVPLCVLVGVGAAWFVERTDLPGRAVWRPLLVAPLAIPAFVNSYAWVGVIPSLHGLWAGVVITTLSYFPFMYLPAAATLRRLDPAVEESARALGSDSVGVFFRVVLPALRLAILGGSLLIAVHLLAEYGAFAMVRFDTFTVAIFQQYQVTFDGAAGSMLAGVLVVLCLMLLVAEAGARGKARFARIGSGAPREARPIRLRLFVIPAQLGLAAVTVLALGVPVWTLLRWLWIGGSRVWNVGDLATALVQTVGLASAAAVLTTVLAFPVAWIAVRSSGVLARTVEGANYITSSLPGIVTALALVTVAIHAARPLYQSVAMIVFAYVLLFMPRALVNVRAGLAQVPPSLEEASRSLGRSPSATFFRVTLRLTAPAAAASACLVFVAVATELTATLLLAPTGTRTLSMLFWSFSSELDYASAAPYALMLVLLAVPVTVLLFRQTTKAVQLWSTQALEIRGLAKSFGQQTVLDDIDLQMAQGKTTAVVGASGCGKTTLLRLVAGFERPDAGTVNIAGEQVASAGSAVAAHRRSVGYVAQDGALFPHLTVGQNIAYGIRGERRAAVRARVEELLETVSLDASFAARRPQQLSGGQQQRVALARALARRPTLMLLDEPFSALDTGLRASTRKAVARLLADSGVTTLLVTHDQEEALSIADQVAVMRDGRFTQVGTPQHVYRSPADRFTAEFLGDCIALPCAVAAGIAECALGSVPVQADDGRGTLLLRPEQLVAAMVSDSEQMGGLGTVSAVEFLGHDVLLTIDPDGDAESIVVRQHSLQPPPVDAKVRIKVVGRGVVLA